MISYTITCPVTLASQSSSQSASVSASATATGGGDFSIDGNGSFSIYESQSIGSNGNTTFSRSFAESRTGVFDPIGDSNIATSVFDNSSSMSFVAYPNGSLESQSGSSDTDSQTNFTFSQSSQTLTSSASTTQVTQSQKTTTTQTQATGISGTIVSGSASTTQATFATTTSTANGTKENTTVVSTQDTYTSYASGQRSFFKATVIIPQNEVVWMPTTTGLGDLSALATSYSNETTISSRFNFSQGALLNAATATDNSYMLVSAESETRTTSFVKTASSNRETVTYYPTSQTAFPLTSTTRTVAKISTSTYERTFWRSIAKAGVGPGNEEEDENLETATETFLTTKFTTVSADGLTWEESYNSTTTTFTLTPYFLTGTASESGATASGPVGDSDFNLSGAAQSAGASATGGEFQNSTQLAFSALPLRPISKFGSSFFDAWAVGSDAVPALRLTAAATAPLASKVDIARTAKAADSHFYDFSGTSASWTPVALTVRTTNSTSSSFLLEKDGSAISTSAIRSALGVNGTPPAGSWQTVGVPVSFFSTTQSEKTIKSAVPQFWIINTSFNQTFVTSRNFETVAATAALTG